MIEVGRAAGDAEEILAWLEFEQTEPLGVGWPDELPGCRIAPYADSVGGLDQDRRATADFPDDLGVDRSVAAVTAVLVAGVDVDD